MIGAGRAKPAKKINANPLHSHATDDHGTPVELCELTRTVMEAKGGRIDLDPFSSDYWNFHSVKAQRFYDERTNGYDQQWDGDLIVNPPGPVDGRDETRRNVPRAWTKLTAHYRAGQVDSAVWIGFALGQVCTLQNEPMHPLQFVTAFLVERQCFLIRSPGGPPIKSTSPTHANYVTLLPTRRSPELARRQFVAFVEGVQALQIGGAVVRPV